MRRHTRRYVKTGKYKKEHFWNKDRKTWFEIMCLAVVAIWGVVAADLHPVAEAFYSIPEKYEIFNLKTDFTKFDSESTREDSEGDGLSPSTNPEESTGETVPAVSDSAKGEEGQAPSQVQPPSSIEAKILKAWEGTGEGHIAVAVAKSESGLRTDAVGDIPLEYWHEGKKIGHSCGIFQIRVLPSRPDCETLKDVDKNIEFARKLYDKSGFYPWSNFKNNAYLRHL